MYIQQIKVVTQNFRFLANLLLPIRLTDAKCDTLRQPVKNCQIKHSCFFFGVFAEFEIAHINYSITIYLHK